MSEAVRQLVIREEPFLADRHVKRLLAKIVEPAARDFDFERVSAKSAPPDAIAAKLLTAPMMAERRTLVVEDFEAYFRSGGGDTDAEEAGERKDLSPLTEALKRGDLSANVILIAAKADKRTAFYKAFAKSGEVLEFKKPYDDRVPGIVSDEARALGINLEPGVAELLVATAGTELMTLIGEVEKLAVYAHPARTVTRSHVQEAVGTGPVDDAFALGNLLGERRYREASDLFRRMAEEGQPLVVIVAMVIAHFRKLLLTRETQATPRSGVPLAQLIKTNPYFVKEYESQARRFSYDELKRIYRRLMRLSEDIRRSGVERSLLFENFLQSVCLRAT